MATLAELNTRREALAASRSSGVARVSYDGKTVEYRSWSCHACVPVSQLI
jgi:hypothetical protein